MIWIIASIPFWVSAGALFIMTIIGAVRFWQTIERHTAEDFRHIVFGLFIGLVMAGILALIAAKICS